MSICGYKAVVILYMHIYNRNMQDSPPPRKFPSDDKSGVHHGFEAKALLTINPAESQNTTKLSWLFLPHFSRISDENATLSHNSLLCLQLYSQ